MTIDKKDREKIIVIVVAVIAALLLYLWYRSRHVASPQQQSAIMLPGAGTMPGQLQIPAINFGVPSMPLPQYNLGTGGAQPQLCGCGTMQSG